MRQQAITFFRTREVQNGAPGQATVPRHASEVHSMSNEPMSDTLFRYFVVAIAVCAVLSVLLWTPIPVLGAMIAAVGTWVVVKALDVLMPP